MQKTIKIAGLVILAVALLALSLIELTGFTVNPSEETIKIGWMGPLTGQSAVLGMDSIVAAQIAVDEVNENGGVNGRKLEIIVEDDQYDTVKSVSAYNKLVHVDGVKVILINTYGGVFALADQAKKDGVILMDPLDCNSELVGLNDNVFCLATDSESIADVLAEQANERTKKVGILFFNSDSFMPLVKDFFLQKFDGEAVLVEGISAGETDFRTSLAKMIDGDVDGIVLLGYDEMGIAMKQSRDLGFRGQFFMPGTVTSPSLQEAAQGNAEGTILAFWNAPENNEITKKFDEEFMARQGRRPILDLATYPSYDAVKVIALALEKGESASSVRDELLKIKGFDGVTGKVSFSQDRSASIFESAHELKEGRPVLI